MSNLYYKNAEKKMMIVQSLLNEMEKKDLDSVIDRELQKIKLIPLDMFRRGAISNIIEAEISRGNVNFDRTIEQLTSLDLTQVSTRNKFRFDNYYKRFYTSRSRGFDFEGLVAGLVGGTISTNVDTPFDIIKNSKNISLKSINKETESIVLKSIKTTLNKYKSQDDQKLNDILFSSNPIYNLLQNNQYRNLVDVIIEDALSDIDIMVVGVPQTDNSIKIYYYNKQKLISLCSDATFLKEPKQKNSLQIRFSSKILRQATATGEIKFPALTQQEYEDFLLGNESTKDVEEKMNMFGKRYGLRNFGRQLPQDILRDLAQSDLFITDMKYILGDE